MLLEDSAEDSWTGSHMVFSFLGLLNRLLFVYMPFNIPQFIVFFSFPVTSFLIMLSLLKINFSKYKEVFKRMKSTLNACVQSAILI